MGCLFRTYQRGSFFPELLAIFDDDALVSLGNLNARRGEERRIGEGGEVGADSVDAGALDALELYLVGIGRKLGMPTKGVRRADTKAGLPLRWGDGGSFSCS